MSMVCSSSCLAPLPQTKRSRPSVLKLRTCTLSLCSSVGFITGMRKQINNLFVEPHKLRRLEKSPRLVSQQESFTENSTIDIDWEDKEEIEDTGCGEPAGQSIFSNFSLLLTEEPVEEPDVIDLGFTFGNDKPNSFSGLSNDNEEDEDDDDDSWIDWEDKLHFPPEVKEIDISKHVRDLVHLEITISAICDSACKGMCLKCGANLNKRKCDCDKEDKDKRYAPLGNLRKQMQQKEGLRN